MASGRASSHLVSHGRGSDPDHSGWVERFSNDFGSNASSPGGYLTADYYSGKHGRSQRLIGLFTRGEDGRRPMYGRCEKFQSDPHWKDLILFHEYFDGDTGMGLGASHQTGWTALVAKLIQQHAEYTLQHRPHEVVQTFGSKGPGAA